MPKGSVFSNLLGGDMHSHERLLVILFITSMTFGQFRCVGTLQKFFGPHVGAPFLWGPLFGRTCWTCLNPPLKRTWLFLVLLIKVDPGLNVCQLFGWYNIFRLSFGWPVFSAMDWRIFRWNSAEIRLKLVNKSTTFLVLQLAFLQNKLLPGKLLISFCSDYN